MTWQALTAWTLLALLATISPGPDVLLVVGQATRRGTRAGLAAAAGIVAGGVWYIALCGFGFLSLLASVPALHTAVRIVGAAYLAWLGLGLLRSAARPATAPARGPASLGAPFRQGFLTNALNPKVAVFYLAVLPQFVGAGPEAPLLGMALIAIHYALAAVFLGALALAAGKARGTLARSGLGRWAEAALGALFLGLAGRVAWSR